MFSSSSKSDFQIQKDVNEEVKWDPSVTATHLSASVNDGIVTLRGTVPHYLEKGRAEDAAQRVAGVRAIANEIEVNIMGSYERGDEEIAAAALNALEWNYSTPKGIKVSVEKGWITLKGEADWDYQRNSARDCVSQLMGVCGVSNQMTLKTSVHVADVKSRIEEALRRSAQDEGKAIKVSILGDEVTLSGNVHSKSEKNDVRFAAWCAPGIMRVKNNLTISP